MTQPFDDQQFRNALSVFATGVTIVTTQNPENNESIGMTASSFNSVSMNPPLILWCVGDSAHSADIFVNALYFCVHILADDQIELAKQFSRKGEDKFANVKYEKNENGIPMLNDVAARFDCEKFQTHKAGDHQIIVGKVNGIKTAVPEKEPLILELGNYGIINPIK